MIRWFAFIDERFATNEKTVHECGECGVSCLPSIGQMIELLLEDGNLDIILRNGKATIGLVSGRLEKGFEVEGISKKELCDVLWQASKEILER